ncbi:MAG: hypothetical protein AB2L24_23730 [Mangrovibacterium sp.]
MVVSHLPGIAFGQDVPFDVIQDGVAPVVGQPVQVVIEETLCDASCFVGTALQVPLERVELVTLVHQGDTTCSSQRSSSGEQAGSVIGINPVYTPCIRIFRLPVDNFLNLTARSKNLYFPIWWKHGTRCCTRKLRSRSARTVF